MKKLKVIIPIVVIVAALAAVSPFAYKKYVEYAKEQAISEEYEEYVANAKVFFDNSFFNGVEISGLTPDEALAKVEEDFSGKGIEIVSADGTEVDRFYYDRLSVDYRNLMIEVLFAFDNQEITIAEYLNGAAKKEYAYDISKDVDFSKIDISGFTCTDLSTRTYPSDAYIVVDRVSGALSVAEEKYGNVLKEGALEARIEAAVKNKEEKINISEDDYFQPMITSTNAELENTKAYYNTLLNKSLTLNVCGVTIGLSPSEVLPLYDFEPGDEVDAEALEDYVRTLKATYDTYQSTRTFNTSTGESVIVVAGDYGWAVDVNGTIEAFTDALLSADSSNMVNAEYKIVGQRPANNEIGNTYVEINLRDQKIYMYEDGVQIVNDDVTTGMVGDPESITITGTFSLAYKQRDVILKGPTWNDFVYFWMPYDLTHAVGMHDASWRTDEEFGGTNRYGNGSHGCVNCRYDAVATIYDHIQMDTPIIVWE